MTSVMESVEATHEDMITEEQANEAATAGLIPTGTYEGVLQSATVREVDKPESPFFGKKTFWVGVDVYVDGVAARHHFAIAPAQVHVDGKLRGESKLAAQLAKATRCMGVPFTDAIEAAKVQRLRYRIRLSPAKGQYDARNWTDAISPLPLSE